MRFTKMQALGNDYIYIDVIHQKISRLPSLARFLCDRHFAVGSDGMVLIGPSAEADFSMRIFNPDGTEAQMCGNALRSVGKYVYDHQMTKKTELKIETLAGVRTLKLTLFKGEVRMIRADIGEPEFLAVNIPVAAQRERFIGQQVFVLDRYFKMTAVSWGNPHVVVFTENVLSFDAAKYGKEIEGMTDLFPEKTNVTFAQFLPDGRIQIREWERGTGETISCGTGCCSALAAGVLEGITRRSADILQIGGTLHAEWDENTTHMFLSGPSKTVFEAEIDVSDTIGEDGAGAEAEENGYETF